jgi:hypothetical protein
MEGRLGFMSVFEKGSGFVGLLPLIQRAKGAETLKEI